MNLGLVDDITKKICNIINTSQSYCHTISSFMHQSETCERGSWLLL